MMNKRVLRKFAIPSSRPNPKNGIFCADQVKYVVRTAIKNIDHQRTLVLYIYAKESVLAGNHNPRWTMFQQKGGYITLRLPFLAWAFISLLASSPHAQT